MDKQNSWLEKEVVKIFRTRLGKPFNKITLNDLTRSTYNDYLMVHSRMAFYYDNKYLPLKEIIDNKFEIFFRNLYDLSPEKNKDELVKYKTDLVEIFYNDVFQRVNNNTFLINALEFITESKKKLEKKIDSISKLKNELIISAGLQNFNPIIDEVFELPNLVVEILKKNNTKWLEAYMEQHREELKKQITSEIEKNPSEELLFIEKIKEVKTKISNKYPGKKISKSSVARELIIADSTFRDRFKKLNIKWENI